MDNAGDGMTWAEIGDFFGIPAARAQQIGAKALRKLKRAYRRLYPEKFQD